ncbi:MAG: methyltransferase [Paludibacter sp.]|nr:methyltransferase [Paludibacter sp.]
MGKLIIFGVLSLLIVIASWRTLFSVKSHGFYRFFSWECMAWMITINGKYWFINLLSINQIASWILLFYSLYLVLAGFILIKRTGKPASFRDDKNLYSFEKTTELVDIGIFKYIRHPLYSSLIFLTWAIFLKNPTILLFVIGLLSTNFLYFTSKFDEKECLVFFGKKYSDYMKQTKMFIPFIF